MMEFTAEMIAGFLGGQVAGDKEAKVHTVSSIEEGEPGALTYLTNPKYEKHLYKTRASIVLVNKDFTPSEPVTATLIKVEDTGAAVLKLLQMYQAAKPRKQGISERASISERATLGEDCYVGDFAVIEAGARIGADGFGFIPNAAGGFDKIPQLGNVVVEDDVEIGANTCIDRAKTDSTIIRRGVKLDNLIQIGHNVQIGENTVSSAQTGIAGTSKVGHNCFLAGQVGIADHVTIGDRVCIGSKSGLDKDVPDGEVRFGYPALPGMQYHRASAIFKNLPDLARRVSQAEKEIAALKEK